MEKLHGSYIIRACAEPRIVLWPAPTRCRRLAYTPYRKRTNQCQGRYNLLVQTCASLGQPPSPPVQHPSTPDRGAAEPGLVRRTGPDAVDGFPQQEQERREQQLLPQRNARVPLPIAPVPRFGTCVQVPHQTFLDLGASPDRFWKLVQKLVPQAEHRDTAILLACLESVYQAEYQQHAGEAISALAAANRAHVRPDGSVDLDEGEAVRDTIPTPGAQDSNGTSLPGAEAAITPATATGSAATALGSDTQAPGTLPVGAQAVETESPGDTSSASQAGQGNPAMRFASAAAAAAATAASAASAAAAAFEATGSPAAAAAAAAAAAGGPDARPAAEDGPPSLLPPPPLTAAELDEEALRRLLALARRAGYTPLTLRDVQLADSLNADYLSQLFIKGGTGRLDSAFVQDCVEPSLPAEARSVLLLQRGYGREVQAGRLLLQKLDYLQTLVVGQAHTLLSGAAAGLGAALFGTLEYGPSTAIAAAAAAATQAGPAPTAGELLAASRTFTTTLGQGQPTEGNGVNGQPAEDTQGQGGRVGDGVQQQRAQLQQAGAQDPDRPAERRQWDAMRSEDGLMLDESLAATAMTAVAVAVAAVADVALRPAQRGASGGRDMPSGDRHELGEATLDFAEPSAASPNRVAVEVVRHGSRHGVQNPFVSNNHGASRPVAAGTAAVGNPSDCGGEAQAERSYEGITAAPPQRYTSASPRGASELAGDGSPSSVRQSGNEQLSSAGGGSQGHSQCEIGSCPQGRAPSNGSGSYALTDSSSPPRTDTSSGAGQRGPPAAGPLGTAAPAVEAGAPGQPFSPGLVTQTPELALAEQEDSDSYWSAGLKRVYSVLSDWGLVPRTDILPLTAFNQHFPVRERPGRPPLYICKVSLGDALGGAEWLRSGARGLVDGLLREVQLQEPTYREVLVVYRAAHNRMAPARQRRHRSDDEELGADGRPGSAGADSRPDAGEGGQQGQQQEQQGRRRRRRRSRGFRSGWLRRLFLGQPEEEVAVRRPTVQLRIYRDIPLPSWKVVLPEKLLQFRPLDLLRVDLFAVAGLAGLAAQARYDNWLVNVVTIGSAVALLVRIVLGYQRMADRFRSVVNELLAEKALAGQEGAVEALAMVAAQQQVRQAALAYVLLLHHSDLGGQEQQQQQQQPGGSPEQGVADGLAGAERTPDAPAVATTAEVQELAEWVLAYHANIRVRFNACQALHELQRLGLVVRVTAAATAAAAAAATSAPLSQSHAHASGCDVSGLHAGGCHGVAVPPQEVFPQAAGDGKAAGCAGCGLTGLGPGCMEDPVLGCDGHDGCECGGGVWWAAVPLRDAVPVVEDHWAGLLWRRVDTILRQRDEA